MRRLWRSSFLSLSFLTGTCWLLSGSAPLSASEPDATLKVKDVATPAEPGNVTLEWYMGERLAANQKGRLMAMDPEVLLEGFRSRPGKHPWIGEHVGKWLHAATLTWAYTRNSALKKKIDYVAKELLKTQEEGGYLGTYASGQRFGLYPEADWDVWVHKYCLIGLITYAKYREDKSALDGACRAADLLLATFGPGKKDIIDAGTHVGMAATSCLEPMVLLYRATGNEKYLEFAKYIVAAYEGPKGPRIVTSLLEHGDVRRTANSKAYEMLSNLVGLCELYRVTGEKKYIEVCQRAWKDIVTKRMYITGGVSLGEHFQDEGVLPNTGAVAETCADVTWEQLNIQLLELTGEAKYADVLERLVYNHLLAAQSPDGSGICYFTPLEGKKNYDKGINCCASSGPRGIALIPTFAFMSRGSSVDVALFVRGEATLALEGGITAKVEGRTRFPSGNKLFVRVTKDGTADPVPYRVRVPSWSKPDGTFEDATWKEYSSEVRLELDLTPRIVKGVGGNQGRVAILRGPVVYCLEPFFNPGLSGPVALAGDTLAVVGLDAVGAKDKALYDGQALLKAKGVKYVRSSKGISTEPVDLLLSDFASAGADGGTYRVWLPVAGSQDASKLSLLAFGKESRSRSGNVEGSIADEDVSSFRVTFDGKKAEEDWFAVEVDEAVEISRIAFVQGNIFHNGGWFDASAGKPRIQVKRAGDSAWETVAALDSYPETTATDSKGIRAGQRFEVKLASPISAMGVRIAGRPASGDGPAQAFASCAELAAYGQ